MCIYYFETCLYDHILALIYTRPCSNANDAGMPRYCEFDEVRDANRRAYRNMTEPCLACDLEEADAAAIAVVVAAEEEEDVIRVEEEREEKKKKKKKDDEHPRKTAKSSKLSIPAKHTGRGGRVPKVLASPKRIIEKRGRAQTEDFEEHKPSPKKQTKRGRN